MLIGFVQGYEELKWGISKLNPLCNGPFGQLGAREFALDAQGLCWAGEGFIYQHFGIPNVKCSHWGV